jgi:hypothetical protein
MASGRDTIDSVGGRAMSGGAEYQARVVAWMAVRLLTGRPLPWDLPNDPWPVRIHMETTDVTDDSRVETSTGGYVWLQAKRRIAVASSDFGKAIDQMVRQVIQGRSSRTTREPIRSDTDRLVLVTSRDSPASTVRHLRTVLDRLHAATPLSEVARSKEEAKVSVRLLDEARTAWERATGRPPRDDELRAALRLIYVQILDVERGRADEEDAKDALRERLSDPRAVASAWNNLIAASLHLAKLGAGAGRDEFATAVGYPLRRTEPDPSARNPPRLEAPGRAATYVPWTRFWGPQDVNPTLDDGYLLDPIRHAPFANEKARTLEQLAPLPCVILLGPMGMGKTFSLEAETARLDRDWKNARQHDVLFLDLLEFETVSALEAGWFGSEAWHHWLRGNHGLTVVIDSVDEMSFPLAPMLRVLRDHLLGPHRTRLHLRVGCRSGAWPTAFEDMLLEIFPSGIEVRALWPLRRDDVIVLAMQRYGFDEARCAAFLQAVRRANVEVLAAQPTTLRFLLESYAATGTLPAAASELYSAGCLRLCQDEQLQSGRRPARGLTARERFAVTQVLAALSTLTGRRMLLRHDLATRIDGALSPREVIGLPVDVDGKTVVINERIYDEILTAGLFVPAGNQRVRWAHSSYAEFLGALALAGRQAAALRALVVAGDSAGEFVVPHLRELAVWLAEIRSDVLAELLPVDVLVALQAAGQASDAMKTSIVDRWLDEIRADSAVVPIGIFSHYAKLLSHYAKLRHPGLAAQLTTRIADRTRPGRERRIATDIAEACELNQLQSVWVNLACDVTEEHDLRVAAAGAVVRLGDAGAKRALLPLAQGAAGADPDDDLRGLGLIAVYPDTWNLATVLPHLPPPQLDNYFGYYEYFIADVLPSKVGVTDLPLLLQAFPPWLTRRVAFPDLIAKVTAEGWRNLDRGEVAQSLARLLVARIRDGQEAFEGD